MIFRVTLIALNAQGTHDIVLVDQANVVSRTNRVGGGSTVVTTTQGTLLILERGPDLQAQIDAATAAAAAPFVRDQLLNDIGLTVAMRTYIDNNQLSPREILRRTLASDAAMTNIATQFGIRVVDLAILLIRIARGLMEDPADSGVDWQVVPAPLALQAKVGP
jgi:hypothetical protein